MSLTDEELSGIDTLFDNVLIGFTQIMSIFSFLIITAIFVGVVEPINPIFDTNIMKVGVLGLLMSIVIGIMFATMMLKSTKISNRMFLWNRKIKKINKKLENCD